jgi:hypothetical protein
MDMQQWLEALWAGTQFDESLMAYFASTPVADLMNKTRWAWPIGETLHFVGLALLFGIVGPLDVRLMGFLRGISIAALHKLVPWAILGFALCAVTGAMFFIGAPDQYIANPAWWLKVTFLLIAGLNMLAFEVMQKRRAFAMAADAPMPWAFRTIGAVSLTSWVMVLYWGRMLPFAGGAF